MAETLINMSANSTKARVGKLQKTLGVKYKQPGDLLAKVNAMKSKARGTKDWLSGGAKEKPHKGTKKEEAKESKAHEKKEGKYEKVEHKTKMSIKKKSA